VFWFCCATAGIAKAATSESDKRYFFIWENPPNRGVVRASGHRLVQGFQQTPEASQRYANSFALRMPNCWILKPICDPLFSVLYGYYLRPGHCPCGFDRVNFALVR
jgi:hypothetical protein